MQEEFESFLFFAIVCALISIHNILNVETSYILEILFYVNIILTIYRHKEVHLMIIMPHSKLRQLLHMMLV